MEENNKTQNNSIYRCCQMNININKNNIKNISVNENSNGNGNFQIDINININNYQESSSLVNIMKSVVDRSQQTDDAQNKLNREIQTSDDLSIDLKKKEENKLIARSLPNIFQNLSFLEKQNQLQETQKINIENKVKIDTEKPNELEKKKIDLSSPNELQTKIDNNNIKSHNQIPYYESQNKNINVNLPENENQNKQIVNHVNRKNEQIPTQINKNEKPIGLQNSGTDCYKNAIIQAIASSDILIKELNHLKERNIKSTCLNYLVDLLDSINASYDNNESLYKNTKLLEKLTELITWSKPSQQDPFEFLSALINSICRDFKQDKNFESPLKLKLLHTFKGVQTKNQIQEYLGLSLNFYKINLGSKYFILTNMIDQHFQIANIDNDEKKTAKLDLFQNPPQILLIHIQANVIDSEGCVFKPEYNIEFEDEMSLWLDIIKDESGKGSKNQIDYKLRSIVHHQGDIKGGHYTTYRKWRDNWYVVNDEMVERHDYLKNICPYILIYEFEKSRELN